LERPRAKPLRLIECGSLGLIAAIPQAELITARVLSQP
jgi:hypothetical protein